MKPRAIELFCCAGGMAEGFRRAGIEFEAAFDFDRDACDSYTHNLGQRPIQLDVRDLLRIAQLSATSHLPRIDLLVADPPCTPWSRAGKRRGLSDDRDMLGVTVSLLELWKPVCWLIGNVPGLDDSTNTGAVQSTIGTLARHYCVDFASLDAAAYGVPQHRVRPFWFGHPLGTPCISWPKPTHGAMRLQTQLPGTELLPYVTVRQALAHLPRKRLGKSIKLRWRTRCHPPSRQDEPALTICGAMAGNGGTVLEVARENHRPSDPDRPARTLTRNSHSDGALLANDRHPINQADAPSYVVTTKGNGRGAQGACVVEWPWDRPSTTVTARDEVPQYGRNGRRGTSQSASAIELSERAAAILQGFPEDWKFCGKTKKARWSQIGMAMPPALACAVASSIARCLTAMERAA